MAWVLVGQGTEKIMSIKQLHICQLQIRQRQVYTQK